MTTETQAQVWDRYATEDFPRLRAANPRMAWPGDERGDAAVWQAIFDRAFVPAGVAGWAHAVEIGVGGGKYTDRALRANPALRLLGFDISPKLLEAAAERLAGPVAAGRLSLHRIGPAPDGVLAEVAAAGLVRRLDAVFSLDALVHADTTDLAAHVMTAALALRPGGCLVMTVADPTSEGGFAKLLGDIGTFWGLQGGASRRFGWTSPEIVNYLLTALGFDIEVLEQVPDALGQPARDLLVVARLARPAQADAYREGLVATAPPASVGASYADVWTHLAPSIAAGGTGAGLDRPPARAVVERLFGNAGLPAWQRVAELGGGDARDTGDVLRARPTLRLLGFDVSDAVMQAAAARLARDIIGGRLAFHRIDPATPGGMLAVLEAEAPGRTLDAVFSIDAMLHVALQDQVAYWLTAALALKPGGWLVLSLADATTPAGFARLIADIGSTFPLQGQASPRFAWQSPGMVKALLERLGFEVPYIWNWNPADGGGNGRDLFLLARLARPEQAEALRHHLAAPTPAAVLPSPPELPLPPHAAPITQAAPAAPGSAAASPAAPSAPGQPATEEMADLARALGQALWRAQQLQAHPGMEREALKELMRREWPQNRRDYSKLGGMALRQLATMGYAVTRSDKAG